MRMNYYKWLLLCMAVASIATAGVRYVGMGPVSGKWDVGDSVIVAEGAFVPEGEVLDVERDVHIYFEGIEKFSVEGVLTILGTVDEPVTISCMEGWRGLQLNGETGWHTLNNVKFSSVLGLAHQCVEVLNGGLEMNGCSLEAAETCMRATAAELHVRSNSFLTHRLYSKAVILNRLSGAASSDCEFAPGNIFRDNFVRAIVPQLNPGDPIDPFAVTAGLWIDESTNICLSHNDITVVSPLVAVGVRFGNSPESGVQLWKLDYTIVYVESMSHMVIGVLNEVDGDLDVSKMTITALGAPGFGSSCFFAARTSYIQISSTTSIMRNATDIFFNTSGAGRIDANYIVKWTADGATVAGVMGSQENETQLLSDVDEYAINIGDSVWEADPGFAAVGELGQWETAAEMAAFYSLTAGSPCIDHGDPTRGHDPDNTRLDIGRFYYHQTSSPVGERPEVAETVMLAAYPNPFNPSTTLRFEVANPGILRVAVWDVLGQVVYQSVVPVYSAGLQNVHFEASGLASGLYIARAELDGRFLGTQKLMLVK